MSDAQRQQPAHAPGDEVTPDAFTQCLRNLETMAARLGIKATSTGHGYRPGTEVSRGKIHNFPNGPYTELSLSFDSGDRLVLDWGTASIGQPKV